MIDYNPYPLILLVASIPYLLSAYVLTKIFCKIFKIQLSFLETLGLAIASYIVHIGAFYFMLDVFPLDYSRYYNISLGARFILNFGIVFYITKDESKTSVNTWRSILLAILFTVISFVTDIVMD